MFATRKLFLEFVFSFDAIRNMVNGIMWLISFQIGTSILDCWYQPYNSAKVQISVYEMGLKEKHGTLP